MKSHPSAAAIYLALHWCDRPPMREQSQVESVVAVTHRASFCSTQSKTVSRLPCSGRISFSRSVFVNLNLFASTAKALRSALSRRLGAARPPNGAMPRLSTFGVKQAQ